MMDTSVVAINYCYQRPLGGTNDEPSNPLTCRFVGGQGRGRTADLPIFSRS